MGGLTTEPNQCRRGWRIRADKLKLNREIRRTRETGRVLRQKNIGQKDGTGGTKGRNIQRSTLNVQPSTLNVQRMRSAVEGGTGRGVGVVKFDEAGRERGDRGVANPWAGYARGTL